MMMMAAGKRDEGRKETYGTFLAEFLEKEI
jgi:hypothetical protein